MIAIVDAANADGQNSYPSIGRIASFARNSARNVKPILPQLEARGEILIDRNAGPGCVHCYSLPLLICRYRPHTL